jgi:hypothetical protein
MWTGRQTGHGTSVLVWGFPGIAVIEQRNLARRGWAVTRYGWTWCIRTPWILVWIGREA